MIGKCKKKTTIISDVHGLISEEYLMKLNNNRLSYILRFMVDTISISHSDKLVCVSKTMINYLHKYKNVPLTKMFYVTNGVDLNFFSPIEKSEVSNAKQKLGLNDKLVFGYVGGFQQWQGAGNLIKAASCMDDRDVKFIVVGGNNDKPITKKNILYLPRMSRSSLLKYYSLCDILVLPRPSHVATEVAAPTKFAEYAAMSRPILTTRVGDAAMLVKEYKCGIVISDNKPHTLINGFRAFKTFSKKELFTMGTNSRKMAEEEFNWSRQKLALKHCLEI